MAYTTVTKVQALFAAINRNQALGSTTAPTDTQVTPMIADLSAEIDVHLFSVGYTVPVVTAGTFLTWLGLVCQYGVVAEVLKSMFPENVQSANGGPVMPAWAFWEARYQKALLDIDNRDVLGPDELLGNAMLSSTYLTDYPDNTGADEADGFVGVGWGKGNQPYFSTQQVF